MSQFELRAFGKKVSTKWGGGGVAINNEEIRVIGRYLCFLALNGLKTTLFVKLRNVNIII